MIYTEIVKKKEVSPDGSPDVNVFDIMQGVSINIFIKTGKKKKSELGIVFHYDLYGKRENKYQFLWDNSISSIPYVELLNKAPNYFMVQKDFAVEEDYLKGFSINDLFVLNSVGIVTARDKFTIHNSKEEVENTIDEFLSLEDEEARIRFNLGKDVRDWQVNFAKKDLSANYTEKGAFTEVCYRPFDSQWTYYTGKSKGFHCYPRTEVMQHFLKGENVGLVIGRQGQVVGTMPWNLCFVTKSLTDFNLYYRGGGMTFPLYLYLNQEADGIFTANGTSTSLVQSRKPNLNTEIAEQIAKKLDIAFIPEKSSPPKLGGVSEGRGGQKINNLPHLKTFRKKLRNNLTPAEAALWKMLQKKQLEGRKFRRQHSVANYILDFYCPSEKLAIELDGQGHFEVTQAEYDYERDLFLQNTGIKVLRFENILVFDYPEAVLNAIKKEFGWCKQTTPSAKADTPPNLGGELDVFAPIDILDYIYAVLHSPAYREKYKEFLKIDFPRIPYPKNKETFWQLVKLGGEIRQIHLLESPKVEEYITGYPIDGDNTITTKIGKKDWELTKVACPLGSPLGRIWINAEQYFDNIPLIAWEFYIGGYQPAQKWLKDRKGRTLNFDDILHYQKIIVALSETDILMKEINKIEIE